MIHAILARRAFQTAMRKPEETSDWPKYLGGPWYELPNGQKVRGKRKAEEAMKRWSHGKYDIRRAAN